MQLTRALFIATILLFVYVAADFHILDTESNPKEGGNRDLYTGSILIASNKYYCGNYFGGRGNGFINAPVESTKCAASSPPTTMTFMQGVCGSGKLDFYFDEQTYTYDYFVSEGNGQSQGTCYRNDGAKAQTCITVGFSVVSHEQWVCYGSLCG